MLHFRHIWVRKEHSAKLTGRIGETHQGEIIINQTPVTGMNENQMAAFRQQHLGFIFQAYNLLPYLTAGENVALPLMFRGVEEKSRNRQAAQILKKVGQGNRMSHYPTQMSGGQQQRVGIARALAASPEILLMDEPFGAVDEITREQLQTELGRIYEQTGITILFVTHDISEALKLGSMVLVMDQGKILQYDKPEAILESPRTEFVQRLVKNATVTM